jgi:WhiB family redox-sensing transcriptional regulator
LTEGSGEMFANYAEQFYETGEAVVDWAQASCRSAEGGLLGLFFSEELGDIAAAKRICAGCPVIEPCLQGALDRREPWGVWGGQLFLNGKVLPFKRKRGRPPKNPPAELIA